MHAIKLPLCIVINKSLNKGVFPNKMKVVKVCYLYKGGNDKTSKDNYRPISFLPVLSKVLEKYVYKRLIKHI